MELLDPRFALLGLGVSAVTSERVRKGLGRGIGYVAAGSITVGESVVHAGRDIFVEARQVAAHDQKPSPASSRRKSGATG
jgi:hypothetical protein